MSTKFIPEGYQTITPYMMVENAPALIDFLKEVFDAEEKDITKGADGSIMNAEIKVGSSMIMIAEAREEWPPMPGNYYLYVPDTNTLYNKAIEAGAISLMEPEDMSYGDRNAGVTGPCGNNWWIATHLAVDNG